MAMKKLYDRLTRRPPGDRLPVRLLPQVYFRRIFGGRPNPRNEESHIKAENTAAIKGVRVIGFRDQAVSDHWTRYRPVR